MTALTHEDHYGIAWSVVRDPYHISYTYDRRWFIMDFPSRGYCSLYNGSNLVLESKSITLLLACARELILEEAANSIKPVFDNGMQYIELTDDVMKELLLAAKKHKASYCGDMISYVSKEQLKTVRLSVKDYRAFAARLCKEVVSQ